MDTGLLKSLFNNQLPEVDRVVILRHITPDGDAVGSAYGLAGLILENTSKDVLIVNYNDIYNVGALKHIADLTTKVNEVNANEENVVLTKSDLVVVVDVAQVNRTAGVNALVNTEAAAGVVVVDHHPANEEQLAAIESSWGELFTNCEFFIDDRFGASAAQIAALAMPSKYSPFGVNEYGLDVSTPVAATLKYGIATDTGAFGWTKEHQVANTARATEFLSQFVCLPVYKVFDLLDAAKTEEEVAFETKVKELTVVRGDIAVSVMDAHTLSQFNVVESAAAKAAFLVRRALFDRVEDAEVDFTSEDNEAIKRTVYAVNLNGTWKISLRGEGAKIVAEAHNGGGHPPAASCSVSTFAEVEAVITEFSK